LNSELTEEELVEAMKKRGFGEWDIEVALSGLRKGVSLDLGGGLIVSLENGLEPRLEPRYVKSPY
jgi:hypothetical protein